MGLLPYHIIALCVCAAAVIAGFRRGIKRDVPSMIGIALGAVCARIFIPPVTEAIYGLFLWVHGRVNEQYLYSVASAALIFFSVYYIFRMLTGFIGKIMSNDEKSILDCLAGSVYSLFRALVFLSFLYNAMLAFRSDGSLLKAMKSDDGSIAEGVLLIAPAVAGFESPEEFAHSIQLEEASRIS